MLGWPAVVAFDPVDKSGDRPAGDEYADDDEPEIDQIVVEISDDPPKSSFEFEPVGDQTQRFNRTFLGCPALPKSRASRSRSRCRSRERTRIRSDTSARSGRRC